MIHTEESISKELARIQSTVPQMFRDFMYTEEEKTPEMKMVWQGVLDDPNASEEKKELVRKNMEYVSQVVRVENPKVAKQRDLWVLKQIKLAVKQGRLPNRKELAKIQNESKQNRSNNS